MANNKHLLESVTTINGKVITLNLLVDDEKWFETTDKVSIKYEAIYIKANHHTKVEGNKAQCNDGSWVEYKESIEENKENTEEKKDSKNNSKRYTYKKDGKTILESDTLYNYIVYRYLSNGKRKICYRGCDERKALSALSDYKNADMIVFKG